MVQFFLTGLSGTGWCSGLQLLVGDFNGDNYDDLLCSDTNNGFKWIDYADRSGHFNGTNWSRDAGWCTSSQSQQIVIGDFNGDSRDDMLCHDKTNGFKWIDYADSLGQFNGIDWSRDARWCTGTIQGFLVGRVNRDNIDGMVCHDYGSGNIWVDYNFAISEPLDAPAPELPNTECSHNDQLLIQNNSLYCFNGR
ncbi:MAG: VCBS repeat-containing protein [Pseudomonadota bacterium]